MGRHYLLKAQAERILVSLLLRQPFKTFFFFKTEHDCLKDQLQKGQFQTLCWGGVGESHGVRWLPLGPGEVPILRVLL